jgi:hypothetical protein
MALGCRSLIRMRALVQVWQAPAGRFLLHRGLLVHHDEPAHKRMPLRAQASSGVDDDDELVRVKDH